MPLTSACPPKLPPRSLFTFTRINNKSLGGPDLAMLASNVVLSALSILPYDQVRAQRCCRWHGLGCMWHCLGHLSL